MVAGPGLARAQYGNAYKKKTDWAQVYADDVYKSGVEQRKAALGRGGGSTGYSAPAQDAPSGPVGPRRLTSPDCRALSILSNDSDRTSVTAVRRLDAVASKVPPGYVVAEYNRAELAIRINTWVEYCELSRLTREHLFETAFGIPPRVPLVSETTPPPSAVPPGVWSSRPSRLLPKVLKNLMPEGAKAVRDGDDWKMTVAARAGGIGFERILQYSTEGLRWVEDRYHCQRTGESKRAVCLVAKYSYAKGVAYAVAITTNGNATERKPITSGSLPPFPGYEPPASAVHGGGRLGGDRTTAANLVLPPPSSPREYLAKTVQFHKHPRTDGMYGCNSDKNRYGLMRFYPDGTFIVIGINKVANAKDYARLTRKLGVSGQFSAPREIEGTVFGTKARGSVHGDGPTFMLSTEEYFQCYVFREWPFPEE